ncbi:TRI12 domain-containing protein [Rhizoctonia solani AG-1 IA]|uniref:TRI12 domain-containing protein n=1 Tax=Thanatephorus cucumeris (strain AG1-IA) TaxID=983506 RepID=L8X3J0_THACA|nr:TRI12 domain-containing protein [Rhizoctonia solani AG-1 IA]
MAPLATAPLSDKINDAIVLARSPEPDKEDTETKIEVPEGTSNPGYLRGAKLYIVVACILVTFLLVALGIQPCIDQTILATAIPRITSDFHALDEIAGRAVAGVGAAGITVGSLAIGAIVCSLFSSMSELIPRQLVRLEDRPVFMAGAGGCMALANIIGPILGGALRWCFYINLPCGAVSAVGALIALPNIKPSSDGDDRPAWHRIAQMDWVGAILCIAIVSSLLLGLQWGGTSKPWDDPTIIGYYLGSRAMIPLKALMRRTQIGCCLVAFLAYLQLLTLTYYLPLNFQSVKGHNATQSGTITLVGSIIVKKTGYFLYWIFMGGVFRALAGGLLFTLTKESGTAKLIGLSRFITSFANQAHNLCLLGYQICVGLGGGMTLTNLLVAVQADVEHEKYVPQATALVTFIQYIGGQNLAIYAPDTPAELLLQSVYAIRTFSQDAQGPIIEAYTQSLKWTYLLGVPAGKGVTIRHGCHSDAIAEQSVFVAPCDVLDSEP